MRRDDESHPDSGFPVEVQSSMGRSLVLLASMALALLVFQPQLHGQTVPATRAGLPSEDEVAAYGGSAGGAASLRLACGDGLADPESNDPVVRQSSRLACAGAMATPSTLDLRQWQSTLGLTEGLLLRAARSFGFSDLAEFESPESARLRAATDCLAFMSADDAPIFVHDPDSGWKPNQGTPA